MKKLLSLVLSLMLSLCTFLPALAEEAVPTVNTPISLDAYQQAYTEMLTTILPGTTITWSSAPLEDGEAWMAMVNDSFVSVMILPKDGNVSEIAVLMQADLSESTLLTFLSMAGYAGAALLYDEDTTAVEACDAFVTELFEVFTAISQGQQPEDIYGLPGGINITAVGDGTYQYYFILKMIPETAE